MAVKTQYIHCDNDPDFISHIFINWAKNHGIRIEYIQPETHNRTPILEEQSAPIVIISEVNTFLQH